MKVKNISIFLLLLLIVTNIVFSQEEKREKSKLQDFTSKTGAIIKFDDYNLNNIKTTFSVANSKVRKIIRGNEIQYFLQISNEGKYGRKVASIAYEDILEVQKALVSLKSQSETDIGTNSDYLENKFITDDGIQVGYYLEKGRLKWYITLEKYGSDNTIFPKDFDVIESAFREGKEKIDQLK
ncbi:hypothetical protein O4H26_00155 [Aequorivita viscosa]|nr:hypothetical protein [Aequorivita viscosa]